jgi:NADPH2:quinone reductase
VNFADSLMIEGSYQVKPELPFIPGLEVCGFISEVGEDVLRQGDWAIGDKVQALTNWGGYAEKVACPAKLLIKIPESMPETHAAAFVITYGTAHVALSGRGRLKKDEWLLVTGAGGGVGLTAVEIGKLMGARIIAAASSDEKLAAAKSKGADYTINYAEENLTQAIKKITDGRGVDLVFDPVGGDVFEQAFRAVAPEGRMMIIGFAGGHVPEVKINHLLVKNIELIGFYWGLYKTYKNEILKESAAQLFKWYEEGEISPHIGGVFELKDTAKAIETLKNRESIGKVIVTV